MARRGLEWGRGGRRISPARRLPIRRAIRRRPASAADRVPGMSRSLLNPRTSSAPTRARLGSSPDGWAHRFSGIGMAGDAFRKIIVAGRLVKPGSCRRGVKVCAARDPRLFPEPRL